MRGVKFVFVTTVALSVFSAIYALNITDLEIVDREAWGARPPTAIVNLTLPVPYVVIHHSYIPAVCYTNDTCIEAMQWMQDYHQLEHGWNDIGYNWAVGGDLRVYEGRGWYAVGAHAVSYNSMSIGICVIGDWRNTLPDEKELEVVKAVIQYGVDLGVISEDFVLVGHRQTNNGGTECPGDALFEEIKKWDHFVEE